MRYALARPDFTLFTGGAGRKVVDYCIGTMNNLGYQVPYGDTASWQCWSSELACLDMFAYATGDALATWAAGVKRRTRNILETYAFYRAGKLQQNTGAANSTRSAVAIRRNSPLASSSRKG